MQKYCDFKICRWIMGTNSLVFNHFFEQMKKFDGLLIPNTHKTLMFSSLYADFIPKSYIKLKSSELLTILFWITTLELSTLIFTLVECSFITAGVWNPDRISAENQRTFKVFMSNWNQAMNIYSIKTFHLLFLHN